MNEPHYGHAGTVYGGYMYISGELTCEERSSRRVFRMISSERRAADKRSSNQIITFFKWINDPPIRSLPSSNG